MLKERNCGILLHITSLPSDYGIGDLGPDAYHFADFMLQAGLSHWQILPLNPVEGTSGYSPYSGLSAFAGNPMLISPKMLMDAGFVSQQDIEPDQTFTQQKVDFEPVISFKVNVLNKAYHSFEVNATKGVLKEFETFNDDNKYWLDDFATYMALKGHFNLEPWYEWPKKLRDRDKSTLKTYCKKLKKEIRKEKFLQFVFFQQWNSLKLYCNERGIRFFGDVPFYVGYDSADVWANPKIFKLNKDKSRKTVAGVPPDYFSKDGQLWGMPIFDWKKLKKNKYKWWVKRLGQNLDMFDLIRLDHFRAFSAYWEVPADEDTAIHGNWVTGPGKKLFKKFLKKYPDLPIIAEDLGDIDQAVYDLMDKFDLPGMKVLMFAFGENMPQNSYIPHHHIPNSVVYTGTHDNNTVKGWYAENSEVEQQNISNYLGRSLSARTVAPHMVRLAMSSVSNLCIIPAQDFLNLGEQAMMNKPSTPTGNWLWRMQSHKIDENLAAKIKDLVLLFDRHKPANETE